MNVGLVAAGKHVVLDHKTSSYKRIVFFKVRQ